LEYFNQILKFSKKFQRILVQIKFSGMLPIQIDHFCRKNYKKYLNYLLENQFLSPDLLKAGAVFFI
jgi:hypothetical protein